MFSNCPYFVDTSTNIWSTHFSSCTKSQCKILLYLMESISVSCTSASKSIFQEAWPLSNLNILPFAKRYMLSFLWLHQSAIHRRHEKWREVMCLNQPLRREFCEMKLFMAWLPKWGWISLWIWRKMIQMLIDPLRFVRGCRNCREEFSVFDGLLGETASHWKNAGNSDDFWDVITSRKPWVTWRLWSLDCVLCAVVGRWKK